MNKTTVPITGMHCRSCELLIEGELCGIQGVKRAEVSQKRGVAEITYEGQLNYEAVTTTVQNAGYEIGIASKKPFLTKNFNVYQDIFIFLIAVFLGYILLDVFGIKISTPAIANHPSSLFVVLLIGLTAGFSTCMALIGGLILGVSSRFAKKHPLATPLEKFKPHLFFNGGRILSYIVFGAVIGWAGSFFQLSGFPLGLLTVAVSLVMLLMGMQLTGISPKLEDVKITLPSAVAKRLGMHKQQNGEYSNVNAGTLGALTFFLPCGFTQAMQLFAMTTGNPVSGALIMGVFAIGTAPGLLGIGGLTSIVKGAFAQSFFRVAGVIVIILSLFNLNNGLNLAGLNPLYLNFSDSYNVLAATDSTITLEDGKQVIRMTQDSRGYNPNAFIVKKGIPVRWIIDSKDPNTCAASIVSDKIGVRKNLHPGENSIEFTPTETGIIRFTCSMGMFSGSFSVVEEQTDAKDANTNVLALSDTQQINAPPAAGSCGSAGCGCGARARLPDGQVKAQANTVQTTLVPAKVTKGEQIIRTTYTKTTDISPNTFTVQAGIPVRMEIDVKDNGSGCMSTIMIPRLYEDPKFLKRGDTIVMQFTPESKGDYPITCAMGVPRGVIKVT